MEQEWKQIQNFSRYEISSDGQVKNKITGKVMKTSPRSSTCPYQSLTIISDEGIKTHKNIHRLVAEHFIDNPESKECVNHIDGNKNNNNVDNLEWVTHSENDIHAYKNNLRKTPSYATLKAIDTTKKPVRNMTTGIEYESVTAAAKAIDGHVEGVSKCLSGYRKSYKGMRFEYTNRRCRNG